MNLSLSDMVLPRMFVMTACGMYRRERQDHGRLSISQFNDPYEGSDSSAKEFNRVDRFFLFCH